jgi:hypothetical protein
LQLPQFPHSDFDDELTSHDELVGLHDDDDVSHVEVLSHDELVVHEHEQLEEFEPHDSHLEHEQLEELEPHDSHLEHEQLEELEPHDEQHPPFLCLYLFKL